MRLIRQENMYDPPLKPMIKMLEEFMASLKKSPPIKVGTPDPCVPPEVS